MNKSTQICARNKFASDGKVSLFSIGTPCTKKATQMRSDGKAFCTSCARVEKNRFGADSFNWTATAKAAR